MSRLTRKMSCEIKEKNRMSFERNCGKQSWHVFGISTLSYGKKSCNQL